MWYLASTSWYRQYWKLVFLWRKSTRPLLRPPASQLFLGARCGFGCEERVWKTLNGRFGLCNAVFTVVCSLNTSSLHLFFFLDRTSSLLSQLSKGKQTIQHFHILIFYIYSLNLLPSCWSVNSSYVFWRQTQHDPVMLRSSCPLKGLGFNCISLKNIRLQIDNTVWYASTKSFSICQGIQEQ